MCAAVDVAARHVCREGYGIAELKLQWRRRSDDDRQRAAGHDQVLARAGKLRLELLAVPGRDRQLVELDVAVVLAPEQRAETMRLGLGRDRAAANQEEVCSL